MKKLKNFIHSGKSYLDCTPEEREDIDKEISKVERTILGLRTTNANMKEKLEKNYRNIPWR